MKSIRQNRCVLVTKAVAAIKSVSEEGPALSVWLTVRHSGVEGWRRAAVPVIIRGAWELHWSACGGWRAPSISRKICMARTDSCESQPEILSEEVASKRLVEDADRDLEERHQTSVKDIRQSARWQWCAWTDCTGKRRYVTADYIHFAVVLMARSSFHSVLFVESVSLGLVELKQHESSL